MSGSDFKHGPAAQRAKQIGVHVPRQGILGAGLDPGLQLALVHDGLASDEAAVERPRHFLGQIGWRQKQVFLFGKR